MSTRSDSRAYGRFDELAEEFVERYRRGESPSVEDYVDLFPEMADEIRELFPALVEVEQVEANAGHDAHWPPPPASPRLRELGDYRIMRELGRGGMGVVYEAEQISLGRRVALKVLPGHVVCDVKALERFRREAMAAARLHHTNIVPVFEVGRDGETAFYAMQFIQGQGLDQVIDGLGRLRRRDGKSAGDDPAASGRPVGHVVGIEPTTVTASDPRNRTLERVAESLLSGRLGAEGRESSSGAASDSATLEPSRTGPFDPDAISDATSQDTGQPLLKPPSVAGLSSSAVLPGGTAISSVESSGRRRPFFRSVAQIGRQAAQGLAYAHSRGVIHRDIKPSNLLLDDAGVVWITDFGPAKAEDDGLTATGDILGTLRYMAPERFRGEADARADIYALGLTLYELLTLEPAYVSSDRLKLMERIKTEEPVRPRSLDGRIPRDLETIVLKAIDKDPGRRYASAEAMAEDLRRFLADEPIQARRTTAAERYARWARRNPGIALLGGVLTGVLICTTVGSLVAASRFARLADSEREAKVQAEKANEEARERGDAERWERYRANMAAAASSVQLQNVNAARRSLELTPPEHRNWEWRYFAGQLDLAQAVVRGFDGPVLDVAFSPDGRRVAGCARDGTARVWDVRTGQMHAILRDQDQADSKPYYRVLFTTDGRRMITAGSDHNLRLWDAATGSLIRVLRGHGDEIYPIDITRDGTLIASGSLDHTIRFWGARTGECTAVLRAQEDILDVAFSPDGRRLASASRDGIARIWNAITGKEVATLRGHTSGIQSLAYSPDGKLLASGAKFPDNRIRLWNSETGVPLAVLSGHENEVLYLAFSPDGSRLVSGSMDQTVRLWDVTTGRLIKVLKGHAGWVDQVAFSVDGNRIVSVSHDQTLRLWNAADGELIAVLRGHQGFIWAVAYGADGKLIASASEDRTFRLWDADLIERNGVFRGHEQILYDVTFSPDGTRLATAAWDHTVRFWDVNTGRQTGLLNHDSTTGGQTTPLKYDSAYVVALAYSPDGRDLATVTRDDRVYLWDLRTQSPSHVLSVPTDDWRMHPRAAFRPTGGLLATGGKDGVVRLWDPATGQPLAALRGHEDCASDVAFSPDGALLASGGADRTVRLWAVDTRTPMTTLSGHTDLVHRVAFSPDGALVASASQDHTVRLWDTRTFKERAILAHGSVIYGLAFSADGTRLATGCADNTIRLWDIATGTEVAELRGHAGFVHAVAFSSDGTRLASASGDLTARVWDSLSIQARDRASRGQPIHRDDRARAR